MHVTPTVEFKIVPPHIARIAAIVCCMLACLSVAPDAATAQISNPAAGTPERAEILAAVRPAFQIDSAGPVEFVVHRINVWGNVAFGDVTLQRPGGGPIDWGKTKFAEENAQGQFDPAHSFFLANRSANGWQAIEYASGPTDIVWDGWQRKYALPAALFAR